MSFGEFYTAGKGLFGAYQEGADQAEAARLLDQQLTAALGAQQAQGAPTNGMTALGTGPMAQPQTAQPLAPLGARRVPSFAGGTSAPMVMPGSGGENETKFVSALKEGGLTNPYGLGALAAYASRESGYKGSNIAGSWSDPSESGAPGVSGGILSWRGDRFANMRRYTAGAQDPVVAQAKFTLTENPQLTLALQNAKSPEEANALMAQAWKFAGWNRQGGENAARLDATRAYVAKLGGAQAGAPATQVATAPPAGASAPRMAGMPPPQMPQAEPQQTAQGGDNPADMPVPNAQPAGFQIPGEAPQPDFVPGTVASPAIQTPASQGGGSMGLAPAAAQRLSPDQVTNLRAMVRNPNTRAYAAKIIEGLNKPSEFSFQVVGDQLIRTSKDGRAEVVPNITKPATLSVTKGSDGNDYVFNPQTGAMTRAVSGKDTSRRDLTLEEKQARNIDPRTFAQIDADGQVFFPGKAATEVNVNQTSEKAQDSKIGGAYGDTFNELQSGGRSAAGQLNTLRLMEKLVDNPNFYSGTQSSAFIAAKRAAASFGLKGAEDAAAPNELFGKLATQSLLDKAGGSLGAGISNSDVATLNRTIANPENTKEGNRQIIQFGKALAQRQIDVAKLARQYAGGHGGRLDSGFDDVLSSWAEEHPLNLELTPLQKQTQEAEARGQRAPVQQAGASSAQLKPLPADTLNEARDAIRRGAPAAKVIERLRSQGYDAAGL